MSSDVVVGLVSLLGGTYPFSGRGVGRASAAVAALGLPVASGKLLLGSGGARVLALVSMKGFSRLCTEFDRSLEGRAGGMGDGREVAGAELATISVVGGTEPFTCLGTGGGGVDVLAGEVPSRAERGRNGLAWLECNECTVPLEVFEVPSAIIFCSAREVP